MSNITVTHCYPYPHEGETLTVNYLRHHLPNGIILVNHYMPDVTGTLEIDLIVLNYNGVYLLEVKHWLGSIKADQLHWSHSSGEQLPNPIPIIEHKARLMHGLLKNNGLGDVSVMGLVVLSKGTGALDITEPDTRKVFGLHQSLVEALIGREYVFHPNSRTLRSTELTRLRQLIIDSHVTDAERQVHGYRILAEQDRGHYVELTAEDPEFRGRKVRIKQYDVPSVSSWKELEEAVSHFKRDMAALFEAGPHPNLIMPYQFRRDESSDERYYLIMEWAGEQTLADRLATERLELAEQLQLLNDIAAGLAHAHQRQVYHRNLSPASIYLTAQGRAKIGDFDFAKVPTVSRTLAQTGKTLVAGRHVSPEQLFHASDIDQRADIFSLGAIWYDILFRPGSAEIIERDRIDTAPLSDDGKEILKMMLAERRADRPGSMQEIQDWLRTLS
jgi:serine/threonine protein kinase